MRRRASARRSVAASSCKSAFLRRIDESAPAVELKARELFNDQHGSATMRTLPNNLRREFVRGRVNVCDEGEKLTADSDKFGPASVG